MARKDLKGAATAGADAMDVIAAGGTENTQGIPDTQGARAATPVRSRINLNIPVDCREYLAQRAYDTSTPGHIVSITQYLIDLIRKDMRENGK